MKNNDPTLHELWEATRIAPLKETLAELVSLSARRLPIARLWLCRCERPRSHTELFIAQPGTGGTKVRPARLSLDDEELDRLLAWYQQGGVTYLADGSSIPPALTPLLSAATLQGPVLVAPLAIQSRLPGILAVQAPPGQEFTLYQRRLFAALLHPFARALEHDRLLSELASLRLLAAGNSAAAAGDQSRPLPKDTIVGADEGLAVVMERVRMVADSDMPVLLFGETGSGKEVIAQAIHTGSARREAPFLRVNCGAIPAELIDSELFGHEKGSFTGATASRRGWFERADQGTLFLDEVGELPPAAQVRLLRVLQDKSFIRVGGEEVIQTEVRIVAATHRDLATMVQEGLFRADLWYRLAVFPVVVPPLRERCEDIPALAEHFARRAAQRFGLPARLLTAADIQILLAYDWPGNVRELAAVMDRATILGQGRRLEVHKALCLTPAPVVASPASPPTPVNGAAILPLEEMLRKHIQTALAQSRGRIEGPFGAAALLGLNASTLRGRMRKLGIDRLD